MTNASPSGVEGWSRFVAALGRDVRELDSGVSGLLPGTGAARLAELAQAAFRVGLSSLLVGAEEVGRLALAVEKTLEALQATEIDVDRAKAILEAPRAALAAALVQLENPDKSGARVEGLHLDEVRAQLEASMPSSAEASGSSPSAAPPRAAREISPAPAPSIRAASAATAPSTAGANQPFAWTPAVDDDMVDLFFDEAAERIEGISGKLLELERNAGDAEVLRDLFRDLHTVKGSSAMVGLAPVNRLAHAAEDLVGQLREGTRVADAAIVNSLLAALDGLREMLDHARARRPIATDPTPIVAALRDPHANTFSRSPVPAAAAPRPLEPAVEATEVMRPGGRPEAAARPTIRVDFDKLDRLLNLVGELVLGRDGLRSAEVALAAVAGELSADRAIARRVTGASSSRAETGRTSFRELTEELGRVERVLGTIIGDLDSSTDRVDSISAELRDQVMRLRMVPVGGIFRKHQRTVRDLCQNLGKRARLEIAGDETELDKLLVEALDEPLMHLVRNAVDHGIEPPSEREAAGKPAEGTIRLEALHRGNQVVIRITDDGRGMDPRKLKQKARDKGIVTDAEIEAMDDRAAFELIFRPGFSTAATVSEVSGRGVGMDVVRQTIVARLKGTIDVDSTPGNGSSLVLKLPLTLAIIQAILAGASGETFAIPLDGVERTIVVTSADIAWVGQREVIVVDGETVALVRLAHALELEGGDAGPDEPMYVILTEHAGDLYGIACDRLLGKKEIVIKSLGELLASVPCAAGATLIGDRCALILDVPAVIQRALKRPAVVPRRPSRAKEASAKAFVLLVDDSDTVRESLRRLLVDAGYDVTTAEDGRQALELCKGRRFDIVSTDVMMPHMDGYELTRALRAMPEYRDVPIVMVTSRGERIDRVRGFDAGVDDYITKPHDRQLLLRSVEKLLGRAEKET